MKKSIIGANYEYLTFSNGRRDRNHRTHPHHNIVNTIHLVVTKIRRMFFFTYVIIYVFTPILATFMKQDLRLHRRKKTTTWRHQYIEVAIQSE